MESFHSRNHFLMLDGLGGENPRELKGKRTIVQVQIELLSMELQLQTAPVYDDGRAPFSIWHEMA
jgi:hypothetical protein